MLNKLNIFKAVVVVCFMFVFITNAHAAALSELEIKSTSFVPGQECRYTISFLAPSELNLSAGAQVYVDFPQGFDIVQNNITSENPGCTLASIQYKNNPKDKYYSILQGNVDVLSYENFTRFLLTVDNGSNNTVSSGVYANLIIPGVINAALSDDYSVTMSVHDANGDLYQGSTLFTLGDPPQDNPTGLALFAEGSTIINATWDPVEGATRYQLYYSCEQDGCFIQACDYGREPSPGEQWTLTENSCSYSGDGNGGLKAGRTYYFKVRAGNEYGFGPFSQTVAVATPSINLKEKSYNQEAKLFKDSIIAKFDTPVQIINKDKICVYNKLTGASLTEKSVDVNNKKVYITAELEYGMEYQVVFYEGALAGADKPKVINNFMGWNLLVE